MFLRPSESVKLHTNVFHLKFSSGIPRSRRKSATIRVTHTDDKVLMHGEDNTTEDYTLKLFSIAKYCFTPAPQLAIVKR